MNDQTGRRTHPHVRDGYRISPPEPIATVGGEIVYSVLVQPDIPIEGRASAQDVSQAYRTAISRRRRQCVIWLEALGGWQLTYSIQLNTPQSERTGVYQKLVLALDEVFGLPRAFNPGEVDMSFLDEGPIDPEDDRGWLEA